MQACDLGEVALQGRLMALEEQILRKDYAHEITRIEGRDMHELCIRTRKMTNQIEETVARSLLDLLLILKKANGATDSQLQELEKEENGIKLIAQIKNTFVHYDTDHSFGFSFTEFANAFRSLGIEASDKRLRNRFDSVQKGGSVEEDDFISALLKNHPDVSIDRFLRDLNSEVRKLTSDASSRSDPLRRSGVTSELLSSDFTCSPEEYEKLKDENSDLSERILSMKYELRKMNDVNKKVMGDLKEKQIEEGIKNQEYAVFKSQQMLLDSNANLLDEKKAQIKSLQGELAEANQRLQELELQVEVMKGQENGASSEKHLLQKRLIEAQGESSRLKSFAKNCRYTMQRLEELYLSNVHATVLKMKKIQDKPEKEVNLWMKDRDAISILANIKDVYNDLDLNQERQMDFSKFCQAWQHLGIDIPHQGLTKLWSQIDVEQIGFITEDQFENAVMGTRPHIDIVSYTEILADHLDELQAWASDVKDRSKNDELLKDIADLKFAVEHADGELKKYREQCEYANEKLKPLSISLPLHPSHRKRNSGSLRSLDDIDELPYTIDRVCAQSSDLKSQYEAILKNRDELQKELLGVQNELDTIISIPDMDATEGKVKSLPKSRRKRSRHDLKEMKNSVSLLKTKLDMMRKNNEILIRQKSDQKEEYEAELAKLKQELDDLVVQLEMCAAGADLDRNELNNSKDTVFKIRDRLNELKEQLDNKIEENEDLLKQLSDLRADQSTTRTTEEANKGALEGKIKELEATIESQNIEAKNRKDELQSSQAELKQKDEHLQRVLEDLETLQKNMKLVQQNLEEVEEIRLLGDEERSLLNCSLDEKEEEFLKFQEKIKSQEEQLLAYEEKFKESEESHLSMIQENLDLVDEVNSENNSLKATIENLTQEKKEAGDRFERLEQEMAKLKAMAVAFQSSLCEEMGGWESEVAGRLGSVKERHSGLKEALDRLRVAIVGKEKVIANLEDRLAQISENASEKTRSMDDMLAEKDAALLAQSEENAALEAKLKAVEEKWVTMEEDKTMLVMEKEMIEEEILKLKEKFNEVVEEKEEAKTELGNEKGKLEVVETEKADLEAERENLLGRLKEVEEAKVSLEESMKEEMTEKEKVVEALKIVEGQKEAFEETLASMRDAKASLEKEMNEDKEKMKALGVEIFVINQKKKEVEESLRQEIAELKMASEELGRVLEDRQKEVASLGEDKERLEEELGEMKIKQKEREDWLGNEIAGLKVAMEALEDALETRRNEVEDLAEDKERLEERLAQMSMSASEQSKNLDGLLAEKNGELEARENTIESLEAEIKRMKKAAMKKEDDIRELLDAMKELETTMAEQVEVTEKLSGSVSELTVQGEKVEKELEGKLQEHKAMQADLEGADKSMGEMEETLSKISKDLLEHLEEKDHDHGDLEKELEMLKQKLKEKEERLRDQTKDMEDLEAIKTLLEGKNEQLGDVNAHLKEVNESLQTKVKEIDEQIGALQGKILDLEEEKEVLLGKVSDLNAENNALKEHEKEALKALEDEIAELEKKLKALHEQNQALESEKANLVEQLSGIDVEAVEALEIENAGLVERVEGLEGEIEDLKTDAEEGRKAKLALQTEQAARESLSEQVQDQSKSLLKMNRAQDTLQEKFKIFMKKKELVDEELNELRSILKDKEKELEDLKRELNMHVRKESSLGEEKTLLAKSLSDIEERNKATAKNLSSAKDELTSKDTRILELEKENEALHGEAELMKKNSKMLSLDLKVKTKELEEKGMELDEKLKEIENLQKGVERLDAAEKKVGELEDQSVDMKQEIEDLLERLEMMSSSADEKSKELSDILAGKQKEVEKISDQMEALERKVKDLEQEKSDLIVEKEALVAKAASMEQREDKSDEIVKLKDEQIMALEERLKEEVGRCEQLQGKISELEALQEVLEKNIATSESQNADLQEQKQGIENEVRALKQENSKMATANAASESSLLEKDHEIKALKDELERLKADLETMNLSHHEKDEHIEALSNEIETLSNEIEDAISELENKKQDLKDAKTRSSHEKDALAVDIDRLRKEVDALKERFDRKDSEVQQIGDNMDLLIAKNGTLEKKIDELENDKQDLHRDIESLKAAAARAKQIDAVRQELKEAKMEKNSKNAEVDRLKAQLKEIVDESDALEKENAALRDKIKEQDGAVQQLRNQVSDREAQIQQKQEEIEELENVLKDKNAENSRLQHVAGSEHAELDDLKKLVKRLTNEKNSLENDRDNLVDDKTKLVDESRKMEMENRKLKNENEVLRGLVTEHAGEVDKLTLEIDDLNRKQVTLKAALTEQENENQDLFERLEAASKHSPRTFAPKREGLADQVQKLRDVTEKLKSQVDDLKSKNDSAGRALEAKEAEIQVLKDDVDRANRNHDDMWAQVQDKDREIAKMKDALAENPPPHSKNPLANQVEDEIVFDDDFFSKVPNKDIFLREFNDFISTAGVVNVAAIDVYAGSIKVKVRGDPEQIAKLKAFIAKNGVNLPSTGPLTPSQVASTCLDDKEKKHDDDDHDPHMMDLRRKLADALMEIERLKRLLENEKQRVAEVSDEAEAVKQENERLKRSFAELPLSGSSDIEALNDRIRALMHHNDTLTDNIKEKSQEIVNLRDTLDEAKDNQLEMDRKLHEINSKLDEAKETKVRLEDENEKKTEELHRSDNKLKDAEEELAIAQKTAAALLDEIAIKDDELRWLKNKLAIVAQEKDEIESALSKEESDLRALHSKLEELDSQNYALKKDMQDNDHKIDKLKAELKQKEDKINEMKNLKEKIDELQMEQIKRLREQIDELEKVQEALQNSLINRDTEINNLHEKVQEAKYTQDQYKQKLMKKKRDLQAVKEEIARVEEEERTLKQTLAKKEAQIDSLREKVAAMNHTQEELNFKLEEEQSSQKRLLSSVKSLEKEKQSLVQALMTSQDESLENGRRLEDVERELRKLRDQLSDREELVHDLVEKLKSKKVDYRDLESILRDKNQEIDYLRGRLDEARNTEQHLKRQANRRAQELSRVQRLERLGPSPMSLSLQMPPDNHADDSTTGLSPRDNFLKAIKDVLGIKSEASSPQAVVRGERVGRGPVEQYKSEAGDPYRSGLYSYNVNDPKGDPSSLQDFMKRLQDRRKKRANDDNILEDVIQKILDKVKELKNENDKLKAEAKRKDDQLARVSRELEHRVDPSTIPNDRAGKSVEYLYAPSPSGELVPRLVNGITKLKEENSDLRAEVRRLKRQQGLNDSRPGTVREKYVPSKAAELVPGLMQSRLALQEKNGELLEYVHDLEDSLRRKDEALKGRLTPLAKTAPPNKSPISLLDRLRSKHARGERDSNGPRSRNASPARGFGSRNASPARGFGSRNASPARGFGSRNASPAIGFGSRNASPARGEGRKRKYDISRLNGEVVKLKDKIKVTPEKTVVEKLVNAVEELKRREAAMKLDMEDKDRQIQEQESQIEALRSSLDENSEALSVREKEHHNFKRKMREKLEVVGTLKNKIGDLRQHRVNMLHSRDALQDKNNLLEQKVAQLENQLKHSKEHQTQPWKRRQSASTFGADTRSVLEQKQRDLAEIAQSLRAIQNTLDLRSRGNTDVHKSQVDALLKTVKDQEEIVKRIKKKNATLSNDLADKVHIVGYLARANFDSADASDKPREWHEAELKRLRNRVSQLAILKEDLEIKQGQITDLAEAIHLRDLTMEKLASQFHKKLLMDNSIAIEGRKDLSSLLTTINKLCKIIYFFNGEIKERNGEIETLEAQMDDRQKEVSKLRGKIRKKKASKSLGDAKSELTPEKSDLMKEYRKEIVRLRSFTREVRAKLIDLEEKSCNEFRDAIRKLMARQGAPVKELENHDKNRLVTLVSQLRQAYVDFDHKHHMKLSYTSFLDACTSMGITVPPHKLKKRFEKFSRNGRDLREAEFVCAVLDQPESDLGFGPYAKHLSELISGMQFRSYSATSFNRRGSSLLSSTFLH